MDRQEILRKRTQEGKSAQQVLELIDPALKEIKDNVISNLENPRQTHEEILSNKYMLTAISQLRNLLKMKIDTAYLAVKEFKGEYNNESARTF